MPRKQGSPAAAPSSQMGRLGMEGDDVPVTDAEVASVLAEFGFGKPKTVVRATAPPRPKPAAEATPPRAARRAQAPPPPPASGTPTSPPKANGSDPAVDERLMEYRRVRATGISRDRDQPWPVSCSSPRSIPADFCRVVQAAVLAKQRGAMDEAVHWLRRSKALTRRAVGPSCPTHRSRFE